MRYAPICDTVDKEDIMGKNVTFTQAQVQDIVAQAVAQALAQVSAKPARKAPTSTKSKKSTTKNFAFTKHDGTVVYAKSQKQLDAWTKYANRAYVSTEERQERFAEHAKKMATYKPSKALKDAIRKDRASVTFAVAKEQYGFVGTKQTLKALKEQVLSK